MIFLALALGWKITIAVVSFLVGLGVAVLMVLLDITENYETGYGAKTKLRGRIAFTFFAAAIISAVLIFFIGCGDLRNAAEHDYMQSLHQEASAQADAVGRNIDAWQADKITLRQSNYLLNEESRWERGEISQRQYEAEEKKIIGK